MALMQREMNVQALSQRGDSSLLEFVSVTKRFGVGPTATVAVSDVNLSIAAGSFVCVVGPSGCGKSSLLNMMAGLNKPSLGQVKFNGVPLKGPTREIGYITQKDNLLPWRTVRENVALALFIAGVDRKHREEKVDAMIKTIGLDGFADHYPHQLSGGMRKRVTLARTMVYEPRVILADEPFGPLDAQLRIVMQQELLRIWSLQNRNTIMFVTHDLEEAITLADRVIVMSARPGTILTDIEVDIERPRDPIKVRTLPRFGEIHEQLWDVLKSEVRG